MAAIAVIVLWEGLHNLCRGCDEVFFVAFATPVIALLAAPLALRALLGYVPPYLFEAVCLLWGVLLGIATAAGWLACPHENRSSSSSSLSSSSFSSNSELLSYKYMPPPFMLAVMVMMLMSSFMHFSPVPWPRSAIAGIGSLLIEAVCYLLVLKSHYTLTLALTCIVGGLIIFPFSTGLVSRERRHDFATTLKLERALGAATAQKDATNKILHALFPADIADRLSQARFARTLAGAAKSEASSMLVSVPLESFNSQAGSGAASAVSMQYLSPRTLPSGAGASGDVIVDSFASASVVCVSFDGLESIKPAGVQLEVLSQLFIAAERIATTHSAVKIKSIGTDLLFVCGTTKSDGAHTENACRLAVDLQRMLAGFQKERSIACISMRGSVAMGPVAAGVIGIARPKYDVWGFTVSVAEKLCQVAGQGSVLVTRDVAKAEQSHFKFHAIKQLALVQGIGKILPFMLVPAANLEPIFANCTPAEFSLPKPKVLALSDVAKTMRKRRVPKMNPITLRFPDKGTEALFLPVHIAKFLLHLRWISLVMVLMFGYFYVNSILGGFCPINRHIASSINVAAMLAAFIVTWTPLSKKKPNIFLWTVLALMFISTVASAYLWASFAFNDALTQGMYAIFIYFSFSRVPFWFSAAVIIIHLLATFPVMIAVIGYPVDSLIGAVIWAAIALVSQRDWEMTIRSNFVLNTSLARSEEKMRKEKDAAQGLLESVVPLQVLQKMESIDLHAQAAFLSEFIPASTTLTCTVVGFDALYRKMEPVEIVKLLNALFSHFDTLAQARGVVPLKTIADEYIVVGNMLREMEADHAERVVGLAVDMVNTLSEFNANLNPTKTPVLLRIGIHSSSVLSGVIRTKSFVFDCWGAGVPVAEQIMFAADPNSVVVSADTLGLLGQTFAVVPLGEIQVEGDGSMLQLFAVSGVAAAPAEGSMAFASPVFVAVGGIDYGLMAPADGTSTAAMYSVAPTEFGLDSAGAAAAVQSGSPSSVATVHDPQFVPVDE